MSNEPRSRDHCTYRVTWSAEDAAHLGLCAELPSLSWLASTPEDALAGIQALVADVVEDLAASGERVPDAIAERRYSGATAASRGCASRPWCTGSSHSRRPRKG
jgi:predicted RNase H-like HicB family nuclease